MKHIKTKKLRLFLFIGLIVAIVSFYTVKIYNISKYKMISDESITNVGIENLTGGYEIGGIAGETRVSQSFVSAQNNMNGFSILFATYMRTNYCTILVELVDLSENNNVVFSETVQCETLVDNAYRDFLFDTIHQSEGHKYSIVVSAVETPPDNYVTMYLSPTDSYADGTFAINGVNCDGDTPFKVFYEDTSAVLLGRLSKILFVFLVIFLILNLFFNIELLVEKRAQAVYTVISGIMVLLLSSVLVAKLDDESTKINLSLNFKGLIITICSIIVIIVLEKKLHYLGWLKSKFLQKVQFSKSLDSFWALLIYASSNAINILLIVFFAIWGSFDWSNNYVVEFFVLGVIALTLNVVNQIFIVKSKQANIFLSASLIIGIVMAFCFPSSLQTNYDGAIHYGNAVNVRNVLFDNSFTQADYMMSAGNGYNYEEYMNTPEISSVKSLSDDSEKLPYTIELFNPYSYIGYVPMAFMMSVSDLLGLDFFKMIVLIKYIDSVLFTFVIYCAMKRLKSGALILASVNLMPQMQFLTTQFTYDVWVNAFIQYFAVTLIAEMQSPRQKISHSDALKMFGAMILGCGPKAIYCVLLILFLFLEKDKFGSVKSCHRYRIASILVLLLILSTFMLPFLTNTSAASDMRGGEDVNSALQLKYILTNPIEYAGILIKFMQGFLSLQNLMAWMGAFAYIGGADALCTSICTIIIGFNIFTDKNRSDKNSEKLAFRIALILAFFVQIALICTALYISFTPVGAASIGGTQFRYVYPVIYVIAYALGSPRIRNHIDQRVKSVITFGGISAMSLYATYTIYISQCI